MYKVSNWIFVSLLFGERREGERLTQEGSYPISRPVSEHGLTVLATRDEHVGFIGLEEGRELRGEGREGQRGVSFPSFPLSPPLLDRVYSREDERQVSDDPSKREELSEVGWGSS